MPFASGAYSEVYQVIHEGVVKAAKKTNLARLGVGGKDVNRVFERFVKELYIMSQMHSDRCVPGRKGTYDLRVRKSVAILTRCALTFCTCSCKWFTRSLVSATRLMLSFCFPLR